MNLYILLVLGISGVSGEHVSGEHVSGEHVSGEHVSGEHVSVSMSVGEHVSW